MQRVHADYKEALEILSSVGENIYPILTRRYLGSNYGVILPDPPPDYPPSASLRLQNNLNKIILRVIPDPPVNEINDPHPIEWWDYSPMAVLCSSIAAFSCMFLLKVASADSLEAFVGWLVLAVLIGGGLAFLVSVLVSNGSRSRRIVRAKEVVIQDVESRRGMLRKSLGETMLKQWADFTAEWLTVPSRLRSRFVNEFVMNKDASAGAWADRIRGYQLAPEFLPAPAKRNDRMSHEAYEEYCSRFLRSVGYTSAKTTRFNHDGGIDVESDELVVQCKHYQGSVGVEVVRAIFGVASHRGKTAVVVTSGSFTRDAQKEASKFGVALLHLDELQADLNGLNSRGKDLLARRL